MANDWFGNLQQGGILGQSLSERGLLARDVRSLQARGIDPYGGGPFRAEDIVPILRAGRMPWTPTYGQNFGPTSTGENVGSTGQNNHGSVSMNPSSGAIGTVASDPNVQTSVEATPATVGNAAMNVASLGMGGIGGLIGHVAQQQMQPGRVIGLLGLVMDMLGLNPDTALSQAQALAALNPNPNPEDDPGLAGLSIGQNDNQTPGQPGGVGEG